MVWRWHKSLIQDSPPGSLFNFGELSCFFLHTWLVHGSSPRCMCNILLRWISLCRGLWVHIHAYYGVGPPPFSTLKKPCACGDKEVSLISGVDTLSPCFSRAQFLPLVLSLEYLGDKKPQFKKKKGSVLFHLTTNRNLAQRPTVSYLRKGMRREAQEGGDTHTHTHTHTHT